MYMLCAGILLGLAYVFGCTYAGSASSAIEMIADICMCRLDIVAG